MLAKLCCQLTSFSLPLLFCTVKLGDLDEGLDKFENAHGLAVSLSDEAAQDAITKAIADLKQKIARGILFPFLTIRFLV